MVADRDDFYQWSIKLYQLDEYPERAQSYMSDRATEDAERLCVGSADILNDKFRLDEVLPTSMTVPVLGKIANGAFENLEDSRTLREVIEAGDVVIKPSNASNGDNVTLHDRLRRFENSSTYWVDKYLSSPEEWVVTRFARQHGYARGVWPSSANSLRFLCFYADGVPQIAGAVHKWGRPETGITDNFSKGGFTSTVDIDTGKLGLVREDFTAVADRCGKGSAVPGIYREPYAWSSHPHSGAAITGRNVPYWGETIAMALDATEMLSSKAPYVAWDIIITDDGPQVIEGNPWPGIQLIQIHYPLFTKRAFLRFLQDNEVDGVPE